MKRDLFAELTEGLAALAQSRTVKVGPGVFRRRGALPRPPDRVQVVDELSSERRELRAEVLELFREARKGST